MSVNGWADAVREVLPHVVRIEVPDSYGSGFHIAHRRERRQQLASIATAAHVVAHARKWQEPIRLSGHKSSVALEPRQYRMALNDDLDLAIIEVPWEAVDFPPEPLPTVASARTLPSGFPIAWCGYPNIVEEINCFFSGHVSAPLAAEGDYLVDGVVIHGVSGGPAFVQAGGQCTIVGVLSQYLPNRTNGDSLPGLGVVRSINPLVQFFDGKNRAGRRTADRK